MRPIVVLKRWMAFVLLVAAGASCANGEPRAPAATPDGVQLTWLSVTGWLLEAGDTRIVLDGYVSRVDRTTVGADGTSSATAPLDTAAVARVADAVLRGRDLDAVLVGHAHWDHAFDVPAWAHITGAPIYGARTVCLQARAHGVPADRCTAVEGNEQFRIGDAVIRVVRWHHSGDSTTTGGRVLRAPLELRDVPPIDPATGGLRPGFLEDYPNGGGSRAYLITVETRDGPVSLFWSNTGNPQAWDSPVPADSAWFREQGIETQHLEWAASPIPTRDHLREAMRAEGVESVRLWIGASDAAHVRQVMPELQAHAFTPHHWDDFWIPLADAPGRPFDPGTMTAAVDSAGGRLVPVTRLFDGLRLTPDTTEAIAGDALRRALRLNP